MRRRKKRGRISVWFWGIAAAVLVHGAGLVLFRVSNGEVERPRVDFGWANLPPPGDFDADLLREWAYLFDSAPLFFPTRWNVARGQEIPALEMRPEALFAPFPARLSFGEGDFGLGAVVAVRGESVPGPELFAGDAHEVFGLGKVEVPPLPARFALVEFVSPDGKVRVPGRVIPAGEAPVFGGGPWRPAEFLVQIVESGRLGDPVQVSGTGIDDLDDFLAAELVKMLNDRLPEPGYYRVRVGP